MYYRRALKLQAFLDMASESGKHMHVNLLRTICNHIYFSRKLVYHSYTLCVVGMSCFRINFVSVLSDEC